MDELSIYRFNDYKEFLKTQLSRDSAKWGAIGRMAEAAGCQRSYLSKVLNSSAHLTPDHAHGIATFLKLGAAESEYFLALVEYERASSKQYRAYLKGKLRHLKLQQENLASKVNRPVIDESFSHSVYYSTWYLSALHILVSIPGFQTPNAMAKRLQLPIELVVAGLHQLQEMGLVKQEQQTWKFSSEVHVPKTSPLVTLHHMNWRQRAVLDSAMPTGDGIHYTVVQSFSRRDFERVKQEILQLIDKTSSIMGPSEEEELFCMSCDLFLA